MTDATHLEASEPPEIEPISTQDIMAALRAGLRDFMRAPLFGLFFAAFYVVLGLIIYSQLGRLDQSYLIIPVALGFPLFAPFSAVGLYDVSRRLEAGEALDWRGVLGVIFRQKDRQLPSIAAVIIMIFLFWIFIAHMIFALFMGLEPLTNITSNWQDALLNQNGVTMMLFGTGIGAVISFVLFCMTVTSLPMLLDREMDFITAIIYSFQSVFQNMVPMLIFGVIISVLMFVGMMPFFLGLLVVLPVLGHATWHLYRRIMRFDSAV